MAVHVSLLDTPSVSYNDFVDMLVGLIGSNRLRLGPYRAI